jgi:molybdenum cofactor cytidylyltransferase
MRSWCGYHHGAFCRDGCVTYRHVIAIHERARQDFVMKPSPEVSLDVGETAVMAPLPTPENHRHAGATPREHVVVLLAAGAGSRFDGDGHKLSAGIAEPGTDRVRTVVERSIASALAADIGPVVVVTGAVADIVPAHQLDAVTVCHNERWQAGQMTSLQAGIDAARSLGATAVVVGLADQPFIDPAAWRIVADAEAAGPIVVATYDGRRANPVRLDAEVWDLLPTTGDEGARALMRVRPELVREVACPGSPADIDTTEDLRRWQSN